MGVCYNHKSDEGEPVGTNLNVVFTSFAVKLFSDTDRKIQANFCSQGID